MKDDDPKDEDDIEEDDDIEEGDVIEEDDEEELRIAKCSFCGRTAFEVERLVGQGEVRICNLCIKEFHGRLKPKPTNGGA